MLIPFVLFIMNWLAGGRTGGAITLIERSDGSSSSAARRLLPSGDFNQAGVERARSKSHSIGQRRRRRRIIKRTRWMVSRLLLCVHVQDEFYTESESGTQKTIGRLFFLVGARMESDIEPISFSYVFFFISFPFEILLTVLTRDKEINPSFI